MKKTILCFLFAIKIFQIISAQELSIGIKGGSDFVNMKYGLISQDFEVNSRLSYDVGLILKYSPFDKFQFQIESGFIEKGSLLDFNNSTEKWIYKYGYFANQLNFIIKPTSRFNLEFGPELCKILYAKQKDISGQIIDNRLSDFKKFEFSAFFGIAYKVLSNTYINFRYTHGITPLKESPFYVVPGPDYSYFIYNQYITIGLRYYFWTINS